MTPAEHITAAEAALEFSWSLEQGTPSIDSMYHLLDAIAHALIAIAVESGVPHQTTTPGVS